MYCHSNTDIQPLLPWLRKLNKAFLRANPESTPSTIQEIRRAPEASPHDHFIIEMTYINNRAEVASSRLFSVHTYLTVSIIGRAYRRIKVNAVGEGGQILRQIKMKLNEFSTKITSKSNYN